MKLTTLREAAIQVLQAIDRALPYAPHCGEFDALADMADDLRATLAEPVQAPLTEEEIYAAIKGCDSLRAVEVARAVERAHGIK